jgi:GNAT superfamily N-acetyltransferase
METKHEDYEFKIEYNIESALGDLGETRFCQNIHGKLLANLSYDGTNESLVGKLFGRKLLLDDALNADFDFYGIFDNYSSTFDIGEVIFDFESGDYKKILLEHYENTVSHLNLLILERIEILPDFRKNEIGKKFLKDFYNNFHQGCDLVVLKVFPIQLEFDSPLGRDEFWHKKMEYNNLEKDEELAKYKLLNFYTKMGFEFIPELSDDLVFICPPLKNEKLDAINMDELNFKPKI